MLRNAVVLVLWVTFGTSALVALMSLPSLPWEGLDPSPGGPAVALLVATVAGLSGLAAQRGWEEQRAEERASDLRKRRMDEYQAVIESLVSAFTSSGGGPAVKERAALGLWASTRFLEKYADWNQLVNRVSPTGAVPPAEFPNAHRILSELVAAARDDLEMLDSADTPTIGAMLFNDYGKF